MASTKARTSIWASQTLTAGAGNTTSSWVDINTGYGAMLDVQITNGGTGPTVQAQVQIQIANDTGHTLIVNYGPAMYGGTANSTVSPFSIQLPIGVCSVRLVAGSNTGQNVTVDADISNVTAI